MTAEQKDQVEQHPIENNPLATGASLSGFVQVAEVAAYLGLHVKTVYALLGTGDIPGRRLGRKWIIPRGFLDELRAEAAWQSKAS